jgi:hypothetical protein
MLLRLSAFFSCLFAPLCRHLFFNVPSFRALFVSRAQSSKFKVQSSKFLHTLVWLAYATVPAHAQIHVLAGGPQYIFSGPNQKISLNIQNSGNSPVDLDLRAHILLTSSATAVPLTDVAIKKIRVLPGQTILESAELTFPNIRAETPFLIQWLDGANKVIGTTSVLVYPPGILKELKTLAGDEPIGLLDPKNRLKSALKNVNVEVTDLENSGLEHFEGKLAILGPFESRSQMGENATSRVRSMAQKGVGIVWIQPPPDAHARLKPSFYVSQGRSAVVVVQAHIVANLQDNPESQRNLIDLARLALHPEPQKLPCLADHNSEY